LTEVPAKLESQRTSFNWVQSELRKTFFQEAIQNYRKGKLEYKVNKLGRPSEAIDEGELKQEEEMRSKSMMNTRTSSFLKKAMITSQSK